MERQRSIDEETTGINSVRITLMVSLMATVAYGMTVIGPNGTMSIVNNGTMYGTLTAPPGSIVNNITITTVLPKQVDITGTWSMMNGNRSTAFSNSSAMTATTSGTITFSHTFRTYYLKWGGSFEREIDRFAATVGSRHFKGFYDWVPEQAFKEYSPYLRLCKHNLQGPDPDCIKNNATTVTQDHIELRNLAGDTLQLIR
jgi:hypothetical protein